MFGKEQHWFKHETPQQHDTQQISYPAPKQLNTWLENLPLANLNRSAKLVYNLLCHYHELEISPSVRYKSLEQIRPIAQYLCSATQDYQTVTLKVSRSKRRKVLQLIQAMHMELANSYALLAIEKKLHEEQTAYCAHRAITHLSYILIHNYQLYCTPPKHIWHKLYQLFKFSIREQLLSYHVNDEFSGVTYRTSIRSAFTTPLLLSSSNPYQLRSQDIPQVYKFLLIWASQAKITTEITTDELFVFNLKSDEQPNYRELMHNSSEPDQWYGLSCLHLVANLQNLLDNNFYQETLSEQLINHLSRAWTCLPSRAFPRTYNQGLITANVGLSSTHYFINNKKDVIPAHIIAEQQEMAKKENASNSDFSLVENYKHTTVDCIHHSPIESYYGKAKPSYQQHQWQLLNTSENGYCLCTTADYPEDIQVGEMISIQDAETTDNTSWHIGVVKWMKYTDGDELQVGIQLIAPQAIAVGVRSAKQEVLNSTYLRALLLSDYHNDNISATIIVPKLQYQTTDTVHLVNEIIDMQVVLGRCLYEGTSYKHFSYTVVEQDKSISASLQPRNDDQKH